MQLMQRIIDLERRMARQEANRGASLRFGTVTESNTAGSARVQLHDGDGMVSYPMRTLHRRTLKDQDQCLPDLGEQVAVLFAGQGMEEGCVLGAVYSQKDTAPGQGQPVQYYRYEDGTEIWYDRESHKLMAKVKGDAEIEAEGRIHAKAQKEISSESATTITLKAPIIHLNGLLRVTDKNGGPGNGELLGNYHIRQGSLSVPDGDIATGQKLVAADAVINGVSFVQHGHEGVMPGAGVSGPPASGGGGSSTASPWKESFGQVHDALSSIASGTDKLLLCLPEIASAEAERASGSDKQGWLYLREMLFRWLSGSAGNKADANTLAGGGPQWIEWAWALSYKRAQREYEAFTNPATEQQQILNAAARRQLGNILRREGFLGDTRREFHFCESPWQEWERLYHTLRPVKHALVGDGLQAALAGFTFRALACGSTEPNSDGTHTITVERICTFIHDIFNFEEDSASSGSDLFFWRCSPPSFSPTPFFGFTQLNNSDFNAFRNRYGTGRDFLVLSPPCLVEGFEKIRYVYS